MTSLHPDAEYRQHLAQGRFMLQRCRSSGAFVFPPRVAEPRSGATDLEWVAACGRGSVHAVTVVNAKPPNEPYNVALIDLAEGVRLMSRVVGLPAAEVAIGLAVRARIVVEQEAPVLVFEPEPAA